MRITAWAPHSPHFLPAMAGGLPAGISGSSSGSSCCCGASGRRARVVWTGVATAATPRAIPGPTPEVKAPAKATSAINPGSDPALQHGKAMMMGAMQMQFATGTVDTGVAAGFGQQANVTQQVAQAAKAAQGTALDAAGAKQAVAVLESRVLAAGETGKEICAGLRALGDGINKIDVVQVADLGSRLQSINTSLNGLATKINR